MLKKFFKISLSMFDLYIFLIRISDSFSKYVKCKHKSYIGEFNNYMRAVGIIVTALIWSLNSPIYYQNT